MNYKLAIVGATGAVGKTLLRLLAASALPIERLQLYASPQSAGQSLEFRGQSIPILPLQTDAFKELDLVFFTASAEVSAQWVPIAAEAGCWVIDNSSTFRHWPEVPLVVPEINLSRLQQAPLRIVANPNCTTIISLMGLYPLHLAFGLEGFIACTYQSVSGAGSKGMAILNAQLQSPSIQERSPFPHPIAFNVFPHVGALDTSGHTAEEQKIACESRRILGLPHLKVSATCVRVPVLQAHSIAVHAQFAKPVCLEAAGVALRNFPGLELYLGDAYPTPLSTSHTPMCKVGRLRKDTYFSNGLAFWIVGDQLWKGAAWNALQLAENILQG